MTIHRKARKPFTAQVLVRYAPFGFHDKRRCRCIPLDPASVEALRDRLAVAINNANGRTGTDHEYLLDSDAVLAALGIKRKARK